MVEDEMNQMMGSCSHTCGVEGKNPIHDEALQEFWLSLVENMVKKNRSRFPICGSFDHPDLQSHNNYKKLFFIVRLQI